MGTAVKKTLLGLGIVLGALLVVAIGLYLYITLTAQVVTTEDMVMLHANQAALEEAQKYGGSPKKTRFSRVSAPYHFGRNWRVEYEDSSGAIFMVTLNSMTTAIKTERLSRGN